jgi:hypothetical protein
MCFSAAASFVASAALLPAGAYCARAAVRKDRAYLVLAAVPFAFAGQQFCEGLVWVGLERQDAPLTEGASVAYLFFALAFWPFWVPLGMLCTETRSGMKWLLAALTGLGLAWTWLYLPILLQPDRWLTTEVVRHSIHYDFAEIPGFAVVPRMAWRVGYLLVVSVALVVGFSRGPSSPAGRTWRLLGGVALLSSFAVSASVFWYAFTSVWCFFAAFLSLGLCAFFARLPDASGGPQPVSPVDSFVASSS